MEQLKIKTYCHIKNHRIYIDGVLVFEYRDANGLNDFLKKAFKHFKRFKNIGPGQCFDKKS